VWKSCTSDWTHIFNEDYWVASFRMSLLTPCTLVDIYWYSRCTHCLHHHLPSPSTYLMMRPADPSEMSDQCIKLRRLSHTMHDFRLLPLCKWDLCSSHMLQCSLVVSYQLNCLIVTSQKSEDKINSNTQPQIIIIFVSCHTQILV
jgi:hypothetical protein